MLPAQKPPLATDGRVLAHGTGVATYARALRRAQRLIDPASTILAGDGDRSPAARFARALLPVGLRARAGGPGEWHARDVFRLAQLFFDVQRRLMPVRLPGSPGVMHWSYPMPLHVPGWINVYTVHDLIPLTAPDLTPIDARRHRRLLSAVTRAADLIVTVSDPSRAELVTLLGCAPGQVVNCGQAVECSPGSGPPPAGLPPGGYLLMCGSVEPRKNIAAAATAFARSRLTLPLVVAGPSGWRSEAVEAALAAVPNLVRLPYLDVAAMAALIANARALLMPSLAEGFGLPIAEAMAAGVPVLTSAGGALAETAGGAALLVDPRDLGALTDGIRRIASDEALRQRLITDGSRNAARFRPAIFADALARAYRATVAARRTAPYPPDLGEEEERA